ncbi:hypothetical protein DVH05_014050 [Phytophthora capsici]|nr:hypothetical protein DVH05_014050 [Phytophthora capsici]
MSKDDGVELDCLELEVVNVEERFKAMVDWDARSDSDCEDVEDAASPVSSLEEAPDLSSRCIVLSIDFDEVVDPANVAEPAALEETEDWKPVYPSIRSTSASASASWIEELLRRFTAGSSGDTTGGSPALIVARLETTELLIPEDDELLRSRRFWLCA